MTIPARFENRMKGQLPPEEWEAFFAVYQGQPLKGLRVNTLKCSVRDFEEKSPFALEQVPWERRGFYVEEEKIGAHPYHFAGVYYSQEPSAMCAAPLLEVGEGERVLDLCSAPGGKGTQLATAMNGRGVIVLNEPVFSRAKILSQNVERLGIKNAIVTCAMPQRLAEVFGGYFDKILIDAPCSGEGMFRKNAKEAIEEWSEENVAMCAERQAEILRFGTKMLRGGGRLVYSTCTFSEEEDEGQVRDYLKNHPQMRLMKQEKLYPHKVKGEGHFAALFVRDEDGSGVSVKSFKGYVSRGLEKAYKDFEKDVLVGGLGDKLHEVDGVLYALPPQIFDWRGVQALRVGVRLGEAKSGRFLPDHSLAMCLTKAECKRVADFALTDLRADKFLRGETVEFDGENGWTLVCVDGFAVGWGKCVDGVLKNHIPKSLRKMG